MSIHIESGYIYRRGHHTSAARLLALSHSIRDYLRPIAMKMYLRGAAEAAADFIDRVSSGAKWDRPYEIPIEALRSELQEQRLKESYERWGAYQTNPSIFFYPINGKLLILFKGVRELEQAFASLPGIGDYHYQNSGDRPSSATAKEWAQRRRDWLERAKLDIPISSGLGVSLWGEFDEPSYLNLRDNRFLQYQPSLSQRVRRSARHVIFECWAKAKCIPVASTNFVSAWREFEAYLLTPAGVKALLEEKARLGRVLPKRITPALLQTPAKSLPGFRSHEQAAR